LNGAFQWENAGLAIALCRSWLGAHHPELLGNGLSAEMVRGLSDCKWPGRCDVRKGFNSNVSYYIDGAHTEESIRVCIPWFLDEMKSFERKDTVNVLLFSCNQNRNPFKLMKHLNQTRMFDEFITAPFDSDRLHRRTVPTLPELAAEEGVMFLLEGDSENLVWTQSLLLAWNSLCSQSKETPRRGSIRKNSIQEAVDYIEELGAAHPDLKINVLVTGSLYLVGGMLSIIGDKVN